MAVTRNDWDIIDSGSSSRLTNLQWITGKVRAGDAHTILDELGRRFNSEVEPIIKAHSWGYAKRPVRGYADIPSEHSTGTAVDFNAPAHPIGKKNTFSPAKRAKIRQIVKDFDGAVRWGGEWSRPDDMHFELIGGVAKLRQVAAKLAKGSVTPQKKPSAPAPQKPAPKPAASKQWPDKALLEDGDFGRVTVKALQEVLKGVKLYSGYIDGDFGKLTKIALQKWLKQLGHYDGLIDGNFGPMSVKSLQRFLVKKGELPNSAYVDGSFGKVTKKAFQGYINSQTKHYK